MTKYININGDLVFGNKQTTIINGKVDTLALMNEIAEDLKNYEALLNIFEDCEDVDDYYELVVFITKNHSNNQDLIKIVRKIIKLYNNLV